MTAEITIINIGTLSMNKYWGETQRMRHPSATCTLIETRDARLLVDPSPEPEPLEKLLYANRGFRPRDIDMIFVTHFHGDHRFGLELFADKPLLMAAAGLAEWKAASPDEGAISGRFVDAEGRLPEGIDLIPTPGHTRAHHSIGVTTTQGRVTVAGDAVMTRDFFNAEDGFHNSADFAQVAATIRFIKSRADLVVPGHGNLFPIPRP
jgi:glyoxylase-like metal-dependent hydrolase (beta-lactamase superfamily II)